MKNYSSCKNFVVSGDSTVQHRTSEQSYHRTSEQSYGEWRVYHKEQHPLSGAVRYNFLCAFYGGCAFLAASTFADHMQKELDEAEPAQIASEAKVVVQPDSFAALGAETFNSRAPTQEGIQMIHTRHVIWHPGSDRVYSGETQAEAIQNCEDPWHMMVFWGWKIKVVEFDDATPSPVLEEVK